MKAIRISLSDSNRPHMERRKDYENSVFRKQYDLCFSMVDAILAANKDIKIEAGWDFWKAIKVFVNKCCDLNENVVCCKFDCILRWHEVSTFLTEDLLVCSFGLQKILFHLIMLGLRTR